MDDNGNIDTLAKELKSTGETLTGPLPEGIRFDFKPLRQLKDIALHKYLSQTSSPEVRAVSLLLVLLLEDMFYNLTGDSPPYKEEYGQILNGIRQGFMISMGNTLSALSSALTGRDPSQSFSELINLVNHYLSCIDAVNEAIDRAVGPRNDKEC
jgi:hypothetical protein